MPSRVRLLAVLLALCSAGPALAQAQSEAVRPAALIDVGALTADSDFTVFMRTDVPEGARRDGLRRLWVLMQLPVFCNELCFETGVPAQDLARLASEKVPIATR